MFHRIYLPFRLLNINSIDDTKILRGKTYTYKHLILFEITLQVSEIYFINALLNYK